MAKADRSRREFLVGIATGAGAAAVDGIAESRAAQAAPKHKQEPDVAPNEDLMREHGVLRRVLLVYGEVIRRADSGEAFSVDVVKDAAGVVRRFIEDYHEKLEEEFLFPRLEKAKREVALVQVLRDQHSAGRRVTERITSRATPAAVKDAANRKGLADDLRAFIRMYEPHAAREDTVLFPAFREIVSEREYRELGERFEDREHKLFGASGFEGVVEQVATFEKALGIYDLALFTPR